LAFEARAIIGDDERPSLRSRAVARILIVGGGCPGRRFAAQMVERGNAVRITTRSDDRREEIEACGAECWIGTPDRLATLRGALENVTVACWMLARAHGQREQVEALHGSRLEFFLSQAIDTTVRGLIYDASPSAHGVASAALIRGAETVRTLAQLNAIPFAVLDEQAVGGRDGRGGGGGAEGATAEARWIAGAVAAVDTLLAARS
jgi:hypothetical protein